MAFATTVQIVFMLVVMMSIMKTSSSLKCYTCSSPPTPACGEHFNATDSDVRQETCQSGYKYCAKTTVSRSGSDKVVTRACVNVAAPNRCETGEGVTACAYTCTSELCNSGSIASCNILYNFMIGVTTFAFAWMGRGTLDL